MSYIRNFSPLFLPYNTCWRAAAHTPKGSDNAPQPHPQPHPLPLPTVRESTHGGGESPAPGSNAVTQRSSSSSELTQISTTDISSHGEEEEADHSNLSSPSKTPFGDTGGAPRPSPLPLVGTPQQALAMSDVQAAMATADDVPDGAGGVHSHDDSGGSDSPPPPPVPLSPPPLEERQIHEGPPPLPASLPPAQEEQTVRGGAAKQPRRKLPAEPGQLLR